MDPSTHPDPFAFANNFWGKAESGVEVLIDRVNNTAQTINNVKSFYRERAAIEEEYARKLTALSRRTLHSSAELGTLKSALDTIKVRTETLAKSHTTAASQYKTELEDPLAAFGDDIRARRNTVETNMTRLTKAKKIHEAAVDNARARYEYDCHQLKTYHAQQDFLEGKELEENNMHLERSYVAVDNSKRAYQDAIRVLAEVKERWTIQWKESCDELQDIEEERINYLKSSLWGYTNVVSTACFSDDEGCEAIRVALEQCDSEKDMEKFVTENCTGTEIMNAPIFINYLADEVIEPPVEYSVAQFVRVSSSEHAINLTKSQSQYSLNQSLVRKSPSASKTLTAASGQVATIMEDTSGAESGLEPAMHQFVSENTPVSVDPLNLSISSTRSADIKVPVGIPSLTYPQELQSATPETSPDPQQVMSREASLSSKSSISSASDLNNNNNQKSLFSSPPNPNIPMFDKKVVPAKEKRSWTSPFRRGKSKKDSKTFSSPNKDSFMNNGFFKPPVLKSPFATNNRESLEKSPTSYKSPFSQSRDTKIANAIASSNCEAMFDLGVSTNNDDSINGRPRNSLKVFGKDDPVMSAMEKLKVSPVKSASEHEEIQTPTKVVPGLEITTVGTPNLQRSSQFSDSTPSSLRSSQSSYTSATLRDSTNSRKHSTQSKELFELDIKDYQYKKVSAAELERSRTRTSVITTPSKQRTSNESTLSRGSKESMAERERTRSRNSVRESEYGRPRKSSTELERVRSKASFTEPEPERAKSRNSIYDTPRSRTGPFELERGAMTEPSRSRANTYGEPVRPRPNSTFGDYPPLRGNVERADSRSSMASQYRSRNENPYDINRSGSRNTNGEYRPRSSMADPNPPMRPINSMIIDEDRQRGISTLDRHSSRGRYSIAPDNDFGRPSTSMGSYRREVGSGDPYQNSPSQQRSRTSTYDVRTFPRRGQHAYKTSLNDIDFSAPSPTLRGATSRSNFGSSDSDEASLHRMPSREMRDRPPSPNMYYQRPSSSRQHRYRATVDFNSSNTSNSSLYSARVGSARGNYYHGDNSGYDSRPTQTLNSLRNNFPAHTRDGRPVVKYCKALFDYRPSISEEVGFRAGDVLLVVKMLEDGWWESEVLRDGAIGLAPSNFLKTIGI
ncbi:hypothetical protein D0Z00_001968 [Geotrichum galactomycetum]|uniref:Uncharacterized protein n=1 Tax=Geotrichum galactomycetum TaxID=27317 RepID=A0ACB6V5M8_9ASCO|nr:hypothetical protein D0Z00_001968 [Geotrichum candidum]